MSRAQERRLRRAGAQRILDELALDYVDRIDVNRAPVFGSEGLRVNARFFAFIGARRSGDSARGQWGGDPRARGTKRDARMDRRPGAGRPRRRRAMAGAAG